MRSGIVVLLVQAMALGVWLLPSRASAEIDLDTAASHFGQKPAVWGMRLSPDGQKGVFLLLFGLPAGLDLTGSCSTTGTPPACSGFAFFDTVHPTAALQGVLAMR